jgi:hypothetical protein
MKNAAHQQICKEANRRASDGGKVSMTNAEIKRALICPTYN